MVEHKPNRSQHCYAAVKKANVIVGCVQELSLSFPALFSIHNTSALLLLLLLSSVAQERCRLTGENPEEYRDSDQRSRKCDWQRKSR